LIRWAFCAYATGNYSLSRLHEELAAKGLTSRATPKRVARPVSRSALADLLKNRYYIGDVPFQGVQYQGDHEPLIDKDTFSRVQQVLTAHDTAGEKDRKHQPPLPQGHPLLRPLRITSADHPGPGQRRHLPLLLLRRPPTS